MLFQMREEGGKRRCTAVENRCTVKPKNKAKNPGLNSDSEVSKHSR